MTEYHIYALIDPITGDVRYVGCSSNVKRRLQDHLAGADSSAAVAVWIQSLADQGLEPEFSVIETIDQDEAADRELYWIQHYDSISQLLNIFGTDREYAWRQEHGRKSGRKGGRAKMENMSPEERSALARKGGLARAENTTPEQRAAWGRKGGRMSGHARMEKMTPEERSAVGRKGGRKGARAMRENTTPEQRAEWSRKGGKTRWDVSPEQRKRRGRRMQAGKRLARMRRKQNLEV